MSREALAPPSAPHSPVFSCRPVCVPAPRGQQLDAVAGPGFSVGGRDPGRDAQEAAHSEWGSGCGLKASL